MLVTVGKLISRTKIDFLKELLIPDDFAAFWTPDFKIYEQDDGSFTCTYNPDDDKPTGTTKYIVSDTAFDGTPQTAGDDNNDGDTHATAYATLAQARVAGATQYIIDGMFHIDNGFPANWNASSNVAVEGYEGNISLITGADLSGTYELHSGNAFKQVGITGIETVIDRSITHDDTLIDGVTGAPTVLVEESSIANVIATAGTWFDDGTDTYVHAADSRSLIGDTDLTLISDWSISNHSSDVVLWFKNIEFWGDRGGRIRPPNTNTSLLVAVKTGFRYSIDTNNWNIDRINNVRLIACKGSDAKLLDNFNYHNTSDVVDSFILEWDCESYRSGIGKNDNCSTGHDGVIIIRGNCRHGVTGGPIVIDVSGTQSLTLNVKASDCLAATGDRDDVGFSVADAGTKMWMKNCTTNGSMEFDRSAGSGAEIIDLGGFTGITGNDGGTITDES